MIHPGLEGKTALVTGANNPRGIGAATARALAAQGVGVFMTFWRGDLPGTTGAATLSAEPGEALYSALNALDADTVLADIHTTGGQAVALEIDLSDTASIVPLLDAVEQQFGAVDILINNAAYSKADTFLPQGEALRNTASVEWLSTGVPTLTAASHDAHFAVNTRAPALLMAEFARRHITRGATWGRIINISTDSAFCFPSEIAYGASKWALESYTRSAAAELGRVGITANIIAPGPIQTGWMTPHMENETSRSNPIPRPGTPEDIADVVVFLASDQARWITGQTLHVGGGHRM